MTDLPYAAPARFGDADFHRKIHFHVALAGVTTEQLLTPTYWRKVWQGVNPLDQIQVVTDDHSFFAELLVTQSDHTGVVVVPLRGIELGGQVGATGTATRLPRDYQVVHRGAHLKWCVLLADKTLIERIETESLAVQQAFSHYASVRKGATK